MLAMLAVGVCMSIHETRHDRLARHVDRLGAGGRLHASTRANGGDAIVADENVAGLDYLVTAALHRHDSRAFQQRRPLRDVALCLEEDLRLDGLVASRIRRGSLVALLRR